MDSWWWMDGEAMAGSGDEGGEAAAFRPEHEGREESDGEHGRVGQTCSFGEEDMEGEDIDHDGAEDEEAEAACAGNTVRRPPAISRAFTKARYPVG